MPEEMDLSAAKLRQATAGLPFLDPQVVGLERLGTLAGGSPDLILPRLKATDPRIADFRSTIQETWFEYTGYSDQGPAHQAQLDLHADPKRFRCLVKGRRGGGTTSAAREIETEAMLWEGPTGSCDIGIFAPTSELTNRVFGMVWDSLVVKQRIPREWIVKPRMISPVPPREKQLFLAWGVRIFAYSLDSEMPGEGLGFRLIVIDEAGHKNLNEETFWSSIFPTLMDRGGRALIVGASKQAGKFFQSLCKMGTGDPDWSTHKFPSQVNPSVTPDEIEIARRTMPDWLFRQEIEADFVDLGDEFLSEAEIEGIVLDDLPASREYDPSASFVDGWDLAKDVDWTVGITLESSGICRRCHGQGVVQGEDEWGGAKMVPCDYPTCEAGKIPNELYRFDRFQKRPWPMVEAAMADRQREFQSMVIFDSTGVGKVTADYLTIPSGRLWRKPGSSQQVAPGFVFTPRSKTELLVHLQAVIQKRGIRIPRIPQLIRELVEYRWDDDHLPETDSVMALALAVWAISGRPRATISWI